MQTIESFLLTVFTLTDPVAGSIRCYGCRELYPISGAGALTVGLVEYNGSLIPVLDPALPVAATTVTKASCILVVPCMSSAGKLYTGIIMRDDEEVLKLAAGETSDSPRAGESMRFVLGLGRPGASDVLRDAHCRLDLLRNRTIWWTRRSFESPFEMRCQDA